MEQVDALIARLRAAGWNEREGIKDELLALARGPHGKAVRDHLDNARRGELLEVQWELEEVLEKTAPPKPAAARPEAVAAAAPKPEEKPDPNRPLTAKDLSLVYDDPRGLLLHKSKVGDRWFATQYDQRTGQPQTFELHPTEIAQLKQQLAGSPYWVLGGGGIDTGGAGAGTPGAGAPGAGTRSAGTGATSSAGPGARGAPGGRPPGR